MPGIVFYIDESGVEQKIAFSRGKHVNVVVNDNGLRRVFIGFKLLPVSRIQYAANTKDPFIGNIVNNKAVINNMILE